MCTVLQASSLQDNREDALQFRSPRTDAPSTVVSTSWETNPAASRTSRPEPTSQPSSHSFSAASLRIPKRTSTASPTSHVSRAPIASRTPHADPSETACTKHRRSISRMTTAARRYAAVGPVGEDTLVLQTQPGQLGNRTYASLSQQVGLFPMRSITTAGGECSPAQHYVPTAARLASNLGSGGKRGFGSITSGVVRAAQSSDQAAVFRLEEMHQRVRRPVYDLKSLTAAENTLLASQSSDQDDGRTTRRMCTS